MQRLYNAKKGVKMKISEKALKKRFFKKGVYERLCETTILKILPDIMDPNKCSIDVGGNVGHISYFLSNYSKKVHSYEAVEVVYDRLKDLEKTKDNIVVYNKAVSDFCGKAQFYVDHLRLSNSGLQNLGPVGTHFKKVTDFKSTEVDVVTIDSMELDNIGIVKIDVEGTELDVLKGAKDTIKDQFPDFIVEIYSPFSKCPVSKIFDFMFKRGYGCYYYDSREPAGLIHVQNTEAGVKEELENHNVHDADFLFTKKDLSKFLKT